MKKIVIATKNKGKVREMREALSHLPVEVVSLAEFGALPDAVEDGKTFAENARIKAAFYQQQTGCALRHKIFLPLPKTPSAFSGQGERTRSLPPVQ